MLATLGIGAVGGARHCRLCDRPRSPPPSLRYRALCRPTTHPSPGLGLGLSLVGTSTVTSGA